MGCTRAIAWNAPLECRARSASWLPSATYTLRRRAEATIPPHLLYQKGWPVTVPTAQEALSEGARHEVATAFALDINNTTPEELTGRYVDMMAQREGKFGAGGRLRK
ncbi:MAG: hypothetical protein IPH26_17830 [Sterolibacteriaceae bacterium]|uniref:Uncharacterized protein n=1 Tax=Candidatus Methylophosphatis roskildensis TaxID=2899263 RepID=A0A9D7HSL3_9PROT|nr:hypothetical protein [Candidatus Methylophosphatis roskildensis]MBK7238006.1 hypothetical protein [Sterolibacteriaceae bacterium]